MMTLQTWHWETWRAGQTDNNSMYSTRANQIYASLKCFLFRSKSGCMKRCLGNLSSSFRITCIQKQGQLLLHSKARLLKFLAGSQQRSSLALKLQRYSLRKGSKALQLSISVSLFPVYSLIMCSEVQIVNQLQLCPGCVYSIRGGSQDCLLDRDNPRSWEANTWILKDETNIQTPWTNFY